MDMGCPRAGKLKLTILSFTSNSSRGEPTRADNGFAVGRTAEKRQHTQAKDLFYVPQSCPMAWVVMAMMTMMLTPLQYGMLKMQVIWVVKDQLAR